MSTQGGPGPTKSTGQLVGFSLVALSGVLGTTLATQFGLAPWGTTLVAVGITLPVAFALLVVQNLFLKWAPAASDRIDRVLRRHRKGYLERLHEHVRHLEVLGVATQGEFTLKLGDVYVDVALTHKSSADSRAEPDVRQSLAEAVGKSESGVVAVIGGPGSGKTTLLRYEALSLSRSKRGKLPILLEIRRHTPAIINESKVTLAELAAAADLQTGRVPAEWLEARLRSRECQVMLDGLDEVADEDDRRLVIEWLRAQISRYPGNRFIVTSRPYGYDENPLANADRVEVQQFTAAQIRRFLYAWYHAVERRSTAEDGPHVSIRAKRRSDDLLKRLRRHPALLDFATNPLLLTMIALVHRYRGALPGTRADLYGEMCSVLLHRRRDAKGLFNRRRELSGGQKEKVARCLAWHLMELGQRDISTADCRGVLGPTLQRMSTKVTVPDWLREAVQCGLLVEPREGTYAFAHLTLQEYLAAAELRENGDTHGVLAHVGDPWWRETILLWAAGSDVTPIVSACTDMMHVEEARLAMGCMEVGQALDPTVREQFLNSARQLDGETFTGFMLHEWLQTALPPSELHAVCSLPVPAMQLGLILGNDSSTLDSVGASKGRPAVGVPADVALSVPETLTSIVGGIYTYRLPTARELEDPGTPQFGGHAVWIGTKRDLKLWCPEDVRHPFQISHRELVAMFSAEELERRDRFLPMTPEATYLHDLESRLDSSITLLTSVLSPLQRQSSSALAALLGELRQRVTQALWCLGDSQPYTSRARFLALMCLEALASARQRIPSATRASATPLLTHVLCALAVHELRANGTITPNEILVLARD